jgi:hypothetical protein
MIGQRTPGAGPVKADNRMAGDSQPSQEACPQTGGTLGCPHRQVIHTGVPVVENVGEKIREVNEKSACKKVGSPDPMCSAGNLLL